MEHHLNPLAQRDDFKELINIAAHQLTIRPEIVYKDYWATSALRAIASDPNLHKQIIFKGGTSLSKGWKLIDRFSEDLDIRLNYLDQKGLF